MFPCPQSVAMIPDSLHSIDLRNDIICERTYDMQFHRSANLSICETTDSGFHKSCFHQELYTRHLSSL